MVQRQDIEEHALKIFVCILLQGNLSQAVRLVIRRYKGVLLLLNDTDEKTGTLVEEIV